MDDKTMLELAAQSRCYICSQWNGRHASGCPAAASAFMVKMLSDKERRPAAEIGKGMGVGE